MANERGQSSELTTVPVHFVNNNASRAAASTAGLWIHIHRRIQLVAAVAHAVGEGVATFGTQLQLAEVVIQPGPLARDRAGRRVQRLVKRRTARQGDVAVGV